MPTIDVGPFRLIDPTPAEEATIRRAIAAIDFPWDRLAPALKADPDEAILVEWVDHDPDYAGRYKGYSRRVILDRGERLSDANLAYVFAHEVGHLIDREVLTDAQRATLLDLMHDAPTRLHNHAHTEVWRDNDNQGYWLRPYEAFADLFLAAFAPTLWFGSPRYAHWTDDHEAVRRAVLGDTPAPKPEPEPEEPPMSVYPKAVRKLIPPGANDPRITPTQVILHVAVSEADSLWDYFARRSGGIESHFYIRRDGTVEQYRDTTYEADANHTANVRAISVETQGMESGEWTPAQLDAIKRLLTWAHHEHGIPLQVAPRHDAPGIGYHVMFGAPGPWTPEAKSCPGPDRVRQFHRDIVPWMNGATTTTEEFDMDENELRRIIRQAVREEFDHIRLEDRDQPKVKRSISGLLLELDKRVGNLERANRGES